MDWERVRFLFSWFFLVMKKTNPVLLARCIFFWHLQKATAGCIQWIFGLFLLVVLVWWCCRIWWWCCKFGDAAGLVMPAVFEESLSKWERVVCCNVMTKQKMMDKEICHVTVQGMASCWFWQQTKPLHAVCCCFNLRRKMLSQNEWSPFGFFFYYVLTESELLSSHQQGQVRFGFEWVFHAVCWNYGLWQNF